MQRRTLGTLLLVLAAIPAVAPANETFDVKYPPAWRIRRVIRANQTDLDVSFSTRLAKAVATLDVAINGVSVDSIDLAVPISGRGPRFTYETTLDLTGYRLKPGDTLTLTATITDGRFTQTGSVKVRVLKAGRDVVVIEPPGGGVTGP